MSALRGARALRGLYAVTPDTSDTDTLIRLVERALTGGARVVQYRNKSSTPGVKREQARALKTRCDRHAAVLVINDHVDLAVEIDAGGVHLGAEDEELGAARAALGGDKLIGISCYNRLDLARAAVAKGADYVAFGSFFPSQVKPGAVRAPLELLSEARREMTVPIVAIGGITIRNAPDLITAGADMVAVISALFDVPDVTAAARAYGALFDDRSPS